MKIALKPDSILIARFLCVAFRMMASGLIDRATNIRPARAAEPLPTMTKKLSIALATPKLIADELRASPSASIEP